jgi:hypothetical protein
MFLADSPLFRILVEIIKLVGDLKRPVSQADDGPARFCALEA